MSETIDDRWERVSENEFLEFESIPEGQRKHSRPDICAFIYLDEKFPRPTFDMVCAAEHDEIWLDVDSERLNELTDEDIVYLSRCGVRYSDDSLAMFV